MQYKDEHDKNRHIKNTDNENTRFIAAQSDNTDTAGIDRRQYPPLHKVSDKQRSGQDEKNRNINRPYSSKEGYYDYESPPRPVSSRPQQQQRAPENNSGKHNRPAGSESYNRQKKSPPPQKTGSSHSSEKYYGMEPQQKKQKKKSRKKHGFLYKLLMILLVLLLIIFSAYSCTSVYLINKLDYRESAGHTHSYDALSSSHIKSILLIGTDTRTAEELGRSDTMILMSINSKSNVITLTSFMRDCYVDIPGHGMDKLTHAYSYGGADLLTETIENNFRVRIDDYVTVNFISFVSIIDSLGGVEIEISDAEAQEINNILRNEVNGLMGDPVDSDLVDGAGRKLLNGKQALSYARIRYVGNADFERTERQRRVITAAVGRLKNISPSMISSVAQNAIPRISTNIAKSQLYLLSLRVPFFAGYDIKQVQIPAEGTYSGANVSGAGSVLEVDFDQNYDILKEEVFYD